MAMRPREIFPNIFKLDIDDRVTLATRNLTPGLTVYGEELIIVEGFEYRSWNPYRSKLAAAILKGLTKSPFSDSDKVLYLGVASGTTCSHISDIVGLNGHIWGVDFAPRSMRDMITKVASHRGNVSPILGDARNPSSYGQIVPEVDLIYADVAQPNQAIIAVNNAKFFLKSGGLLVIAIKSRSVDVSLSPNRVYTSQIGILEEGGFNILEFLRLDPYERDHAMVIAKYTT